MNSGRKQGDKKVYAREGNRGCRLAQNHPGTTSPPRWTLSSSLGAKRTQGVSPHLHEGELLLAGVVVARGPLVLLRRARAVLVTELVCGVNQLPGVLGRA